MPPTAVFHVLALAKLVPQPPSVLLVSLPVTLPTQLELACLRAEMDSLSEPRLAILAIVTHQGASTARSKPGTLALDNLQFARLPSPQPPQFPQLPQFPRLPQLLQLPQFPQLPQQPPRLCISLVL